MIEYDPGSCTLRFLCRIYGSVFPKALMWAVPSAMLAYVVARIQHLTGHGFDLKGSDETMRTLWVTFEYILGFLCVFRTQQAYGRYMEGVLMLRQMRTEWINAVTSLIAFSSRKSQKRAEVDHFQHLLVRLMSLLSCYTLQSMSDNVDDQMPVLNLTGLDRHCIYFLQSKNSYSQRMEIVKHWIQRLVIEQYELGVITVDPPILARFFQDIDHGAMCACQARNLTEIPFPFPYVQMLTVMLLVHSIITPVLAGALVSSEVWGAVFTCISVLGFVGTNYIACEIESPFGDDANDLPLVNIQQDMNASFWILLEPQTQEVPSFQFNKSIHRKWQTDMFGDPSPTRLSTMSIHQSSSSRGTSPWLSISNGHSKEESFSPNSRLSFEKPSSPCRSKSNIFSSTTAPDMLASNVTDLDCYSMSNPGQSQTVSVESSLAPGSKDLREQRREVGLQELGLTSKAPTHPSNAPTNYSSEVAVRSGVSSALGGRDSGSTPKSGGKVEPMRSSFFGAINMGKGKIVMPDLDSFDSDIDDSGQHLLPPKYTSASTESNHSLKVIDRSMNVPHTIGEKLKSPRFQNENVAVALTRI